MSDYKLRLVEDNLAAGGQISLAEIAGCRVIYVARGTVEIEPEGSSGGAETLAENSGRFGSAAGVARTDHGTTLWRWELVKRSEDDWPADAQSNLKASHELELDPPDGEYMMRCDRVDFPLGGVAYTHIHSGPGLRCLLRGELRVLVDETEETVVEPGGTWFESGPDPIFAQASDTELTSFVRSMVLPRSYKGTTSITYVKPEDADKPKPQEYTRYVDEFINL